jgi:hypothetical protein
MTGKDESILQALTTNYSNGSKKLGLSNLFRKNVLIMYHEKGYQCYHFDCDADCYPDLDISGL